MILGKIFPKKIAQCPVCGYKFKVPNKKIVVCEKCGEKLQLNKKNIFTQPFRKSLSENTGISEIKKKENYKGKHFDIRY